MGLDLRPKRPSSKTLKRWNNLHRRQPLADLRTSGVIVHLVPWTSLQTLGTRTAERKRQKNESLKKEGEKVKCEPTVQISVSVRQARTESTGADTQQQNTQWAANNYKHASHLHQNKPRLTTSGIHPHSTSPRQRNYTAWRRKTRYDITARVSVQPQLSNFPTL